MEFSNHKVDIDNDNLGAGSCGSIETPLRLPEPPVLHIGPPTIGHSAHFAAIDSYIVATCPSTDPRRNTGVTLTYDPKTSL
jgi:hypothetical protein